MTIILNTVQEKEERYITQMTRNLTDMSKIDWIGLQSTVGVRSGCFKHPGTPQPDPSSDGPGGQCSLCMSADDSHDPKVRAG